MDDRFTIGEFSRITHLSIRTLRRYHDQGLLVPAEVDRSSGYRYYSSHQIRPALAIRRLRELDVPLADVRRYLAATADPAVAGADLTTSEQIIAAHLRRLEDRIGRTQRAVEGLRELLDPSTERSVTLDVLPAQDVLAVTLDDVTTDDLGWYDTAMRDLDRAVTHRPVGAPGGRYTHELFTEGRGHATVYLPADADLSPHPPPNVRTLRLPERSAAVATHAGAHDDLDLTYSAVGSFAARHGLHHQDVAEEIYLIGPRDTDQPDRWRTVVAWLVS